MDKFTKITWDNFYNINELLVDKVSYMKKGNAVDFEYCLDESMIDCESPIEQLLAMEFERIGLLNIGLFNPIIEIKDFQKQKYIKCNDKNYRVDFYICVQYKNKKKDIVVEKKFIIECDGYEFHRRTKEEFDYESKRSRDLKKLGHEIISFSGREIMKSPYMCALDVINIIISKQDEVL